MVILNYSWRQILVQSAYQILVILTLMYFGVFIFFEKENRFNIITKKRIEANDIGVALPTGRLELDTIIFHTFILMNLFNQINCRIVDSDEKSDLNIFRGLMTHYQFLIVLAGEFAIQNLMVLWFSSGALAMNIFGVAPFSKPWINPTCYVLGAMSLLVNVVVKKIPIDYFDNINNKVNLEIPNNEEWINVQM